MRPANFWHRANFNTKELLQTESDLHREPFTKRICYTETAFTQSTLLHRKVFAQKYRILKHYLKVFLKGKSSAPKWKKSAAQASFATFMQPLQCNLDFQQQTMGFTRAAAAARNLNAAIPLRSADTGVAKHKKKYAQRLHKLQLQEPDLDGSEASLHSWSYNWGERLNAS